jgi:hypothetical protein
MNTLQLYLFTLMCRVAGADFMDGRCGFPAGLFRQVRFCSAQCKFVLRRRLVSEGLPDSECSEL